MKEKIVPKLSAEITDRYNKIISKMLFSVLPDFESAVIAGFFTGSTNTVVDIRIYYRPKKSNEYRAMTKDMIEVADVDFRDIFRSLRKYFNDNGDNFESYTVSLNSDTLTYKAKAGRERILFITKQFLDKWEKELTEVI